MLSRPFRHLPAGAVVAIAALLFASTGCGGPEPLTPDAHEAAPPPSAAATSATSPGPGSELSTPDKAKAAIYAALKADDKEAFKKLLTKQNLAKHEKHFDEWYEIWRSAAARAPEAFKGIRLAEEGGSWKLDEN